MTRSICSKALWLILFITWSFSITIGQTGPPGTRNTMIISSKSFQHEGLIPVRYTCIGFNISPDISWSGIPRGTRSFALICNDPDAPSGNWIHWVLFNIPVSVNRLPENFKLGRAVSGSIKTGRNDAGLLGYSGPCPPSGIHRYYFRVYALDVVLKADEGLSAAELEKLMEGHILGKGELMGKYQRK
jgi:Raf kinase inhibitor-like YbhB/YbcL family protein